MTIIDTVTLDGLEIGKKYQLKGWQMIKDENAELINPKITAEGKNVRGRGYTNYILTADDMLPAEESK